MLSLNGTEVPFRCLVLKGLSEHEINVTISSSTIKYPFQPLSLAVTCLCDFVTVFFHTLSARVCKIHRTVQTATPSLFPRGDPFSPRFYKVYPLFLQQLFVNTDTCAQSRLHVK